MSALLIHLTGGRSKHTFMSSARCDSSILPRLEGADLGRGSRLCGPHSSGIFWPQSVYACSTPDLASLEHAGWVIFEVAFLVISIRKI